MLRQSGNELTNFLESHSGPAALLQVEGGMSYANGEFERLYGDRLEGRRWFEEVVPRAVREELLLGVTSGTRGAIPAFRTGDGSLGKERGGRTGIDIRWRCTIQRDTTGRGTGIVCLGEEWQVEREMEWEVRAEKLRLDQADRLAKLGHWKLNFKTGKLHWSDETYRIFETTREEFEATYEGYLKHVHPEDRALVDQTFRESVEQRKGYEIAHRLLLEGERVKYVRGAGETIYEGDGTPIRSFGIVQDVTPQKTTKESLQIRQRAIDTSSAAIGFATLDGRLSYANESFLKMWGYESFEELAGIDVRFLWKDPEEVGGILERMSRGEQYRGRLKAVRKEGEEFIATVYSEQIRDEEGAALCYIGWILNDTERYEAIQELDREQRLRTTIIETAPVCIKVINREGVIESINRTGLGYLDADSESEVVGRVAKEFLGEEHHGEVAELVGRTFAGETTEVRVRVIGLKGREIVADSFLAPIRNSSDEVTGVLSVSRDITLQHANEREMIEGREKLQAILDHLPMTVFTYNMEGITQQVEGTVLSDLGMSPEEIVGRSIYNLAEGREHILRSIWEALEGRANTVQCIQPGGRTFEIRQTPLFDDGRKQTGVIALMLEITEQARTLRELADTTMRYSSVFDALSEGVVVIEKSGSILDANPRAERILGFDRRELATMTPSSPEWNAIHEDGSPFPVEKHPSMNTLRTGVAERDVVMGIQTTGERVWLSINSQPLIRQGEEKPFATVVSFSDITSRKELAERERQTREELMHALRINTLGEMATGIAHELNQPLTSIAATAFSAQQDLMKLAGSSELTARLQKFHELIIDQSMRAGEIIRQLRRLAKKGEPKQTPCRVTEIVNDVLSTFRTDLQREHVRLNVLAEEDLPAVMTDPVQIQQVLLNLIRNSLEAMRLKLRDEREIRIEARRSEGPGGRIEILVSDTGTGIDPEILPNLFEPYVTTKSEGLGLGLPICKTIIESQGGRLNVAATGPRGTTFQFTLKRASEGEDAS